MNYALYKLWENKNKKNIGVILLLTILNRRRSSHIDVPVSIDSAS